MSKTVVTRKQHTVNGWRRLWARRRGLARPTLPHAGLRVRVHIPASPSSSRPWLSPACAWTRRCACPSSTPHSPGLPHPSVTPLVWGASATADTVYTSAFRRGQYGYGLAAAAVMILECMVVMMVINYIFRDKDEEKSRRKIRHEEKVFF